MLKKKNIKHPLLGTVVISYDTRARRIIMRVRDGVIYVTVPIHTTNEEIKSVLNKYKEELEEMQNRYTSNLVDEKFSISTQHLTLQLKKYKGKGLRLTGSNGDYTILYPSSIDFECDESQLAVKKAIRAVFLHRAKEILPQRLQQLAQQHNFSYKSVTIRNTRTRWGSCSSSATISLNMRILVLPQHLIDYVLLHELCHTVEMNHSRRFWALVEKVCGPSWKSLYAELNGYSTELWYID